LRSLPVIVVECEGVDIVGVFFYALLPAAASSPASCCLLPAVCHLLVVSPAACCCSFVALFLRAVGGGVEDMQPVRGLFCSNPEWVRCREG